MGLLLNVDDLSEEKKFYERFWALLRNRDLMRVFETYGPEAFRRSSVLEGFEAFIDQNGFMGTTCVEIGTLNGLTAVVLARRFERVVSIDIVDSARKREIVDLLGIGNIDFVNVRDNAEKASIVDGLQFDAAYVDGDHTNDTATDFALVKRCGRVLFHEHWSAQPAVIDLVAGLNNVVAAGKLALWTV